MNLFCLFIQVQQLLEDSHFNKSISVSLIAIFIMKWENLHIYSLFTVCIICNNLSVQSSESVIIVEDNFCIFFMRAIWQPLGVLVIDACASVPINVRIRTRFPSSIVVRAVGDWQLIVHTAGFISRKSYFPIRFTNGRISTVEKLAALRGRRQDPSFSSLFPAIDSRNLTCRVTRIRLICDNFPCLPLRRETWIHLIITCLSQELLLNSSQHCLHF